MDSPLLFAIFAFLTLMVAMTGVAYRLYYKPGRMLRQLGSPVITNDPRIGGVARSSEQGGYTIVTMLSSIGSKVPSSDAEVATLRTNLLRAGFRSENALPVFYAMRIL